jgi:carbon storage regulator
VAALLVLVLSRRMGEQIVINGCVKITLLEMSGNRVRVGVDAPHAIRVDRAEIHERRQLANEFVVPTPLIFRSGSPGTSP